MKHVLFETGDKNAPESIKDRNGEVVLSLCKICGKGEADLRGGCIDGNELIARFMEVPKCDRCEDCGKYRYGPGLFYAPREMNYRTSWEWLMPVIEKVGQIEMPDDRYPNGNRIYVESIYPRTFGMKDEGGQYMFRFNGFFLHKSDKLIECAYDAVVETLRYVGVYQNKQ